MLGWHNIICCVPVKKVMFRQTVIHHWLKIPDRWASCGRLVPSVRRVHVFAIIWAALSSIFCCYGLKERQQQHYWLIELNIPLHFHQGGKVILYKTVRWGWSLTAKPSKVHLCLKVLFLSISQDLEAFDLFPLCLCSLCPLSLACSRSLPALSVHDL